MHADEAQLLAERGQREVGVDRRDRQAAADRRQARPEPRPEQPAAGKGVQRLDDLVAVAGGSSKGSSQMSTRVWTSADEAVHHERAGEEQEDADDDVAEPRRSRRRAGTGTR